MRHIITIVFLTSFACAHTLPLKNTKPYVQMTETGSCIVKYGDLSVKSKMVGPCIFSQKDNSPSSRTIDGKTYFLLVGKPAGKEFLSNWNVSESEMCSDQAQLVLIAHRFR